MSNTEEQAVQLCLQIAIPVATPSEGLAVTDELVSKKAIAREKRKNKNRITAGSGDRDRTPPAALSQKAIANHTTNSPSPGETLEQTLELAARDDNGERSADSRTNPLPPGETLEKISMSDFSPEPPAPPPKSCSRVSDAGETLEQPGTTAGGGIEHSPAAAFPNNYSSSGETLEQASMSDWTPAAGLSVLESHSRTETLEQPDPAPKEVGDSAPEAVPEQSVLESLEPASQTLEQISQPTAALGAPDASGQSVLESHSRTNSQFPIPDPSPSMQRRYDEEELMAEFPPTHPEGDRGWEARGWFAKQYKWLDENGKQHTSSQFPIVPCSTKVYGPYVIFCHHREGASDKRRHLGLPSSPKYRNFIHHWKQCSSVEEAIEFFEKKQPAAATHASGSHPKNSDAY